MSEHDPGREAVWARTGLVAGLTATAVVAVVVTTTRVYGLNFSVAGPNATVLLLAPLVTGWAVAGATLAPRQLWSGGLAALLCGLAAATLATGVVAAVGAAIAATAATPLLVAAVGSLRERAAVGVALGLLVVVGVRVWTRSAPAATTTTGAAVALVVGVGTAATAVALARIGGLPDPEREETASTAPLWALLVAEAALLGAPGALAGWVSRPYGPTAALSVAGLVAGGALVAVRGVTTDRETAAVGLAYLLGSAAVLAVGGLPGAVGAGIAQFGAVGLLAVGCRPRPRRATWRVAAGLAATQVVAVGTLFLFVVAANWAFFPAPVGDAVRGLGPAFLAATLLVFPATVVVGWRTTTGATPIASDRRTALATVGAGVLSVAGLARPTAPVGDAADGTLTVTTYNVHQYLSGDGDDWNLSAVRSVLDDTDADVIGLQESEGRRITSGGVDGVRWLAAELGYHVCEGPPTGALTYGVALLSRHPIRDRRVVFPPTDRSPPRPLLVATVAAPDGDVPVVVAHLQTQQRTTDGPREGAVAAQIEQAEAVLAAADDPRTVVLGDFNSSPGDDAYERLAGSLTDAWPVARPDADDAVGYTWSASRPDRRIDHVFVGSAWTPTDASVSGDPAASDHRAVTVDLVDDG